MKSVYDASVGYAFIRTLGNPKLRPASLRCIFLIFRNFFFRQFCYAALPGRVPVSRADHPLDLKIPFVPAWVNVYIDFVPYWLRVLTFLLKNHGRRSLGAVREFVVSMGDLYLYASKVYSKNLSTTDRPFYIARSRFLLIHLTDPHLMCIPSLHVMVAVFTYTKFAAILRELEGAEENDERIEEMKRGALAICQAILFVKQHSVNCIGASLYAMTRFDPELLPPEKAEAFCSMLFNRFPPAFSPRRSCIRIAADCALGPASSCERCLLSAPKQKLPAADVAEIRAHILSCYRGFLEKGKTAQSWEEPILEFLRGLPRA